MRVACGCGTTHNGPICPNPECTWVPLSIGTPQEHADALAMRRQAAELRELETVEPPPLKGPESA